MVIESVKLTISAYFEPMTDLIIESIIRQYDFNLVYANALVEDLSEEQMTITPSEGLVNHPAFTLGHLVSGSAMMTEDLGATLEMPEGWAGIFLRKGPGDPALPHRDPTVYPSKSNLLLELEAQHEKLKHILVGMDMHKLREPAQWRFGKYFPTLLDLTAFMCISHEAMHLGQLAAWRRACGLPSALAIII